MTSFLAFKNSSQPNVTGSGQWVTGIYNLPQYDAEGEYNASTGVFTAKKSGKCLFNFSLGLTGLGASHNNCAIAVWKNGSEYHHAWLGHGAYAANGFSSTGQSGSIILYLNKGDTVEIKGYAGGGAQIISLDAGISPYFSGESIK